MTPDGGFLIADTANNRIRKVPPGGTIVTVAGAGAAGLAGDGGLATSALIYAPEGVAAIPDGGFLIADSGNDRVRRVSPAGVITTLAGSARGFSGDGGPAVAARLDLPWGVTATAGGGALIADYDNARIRAVEGASPVGGAAPSAPGAPMPSPAAPARAPAFGADERLAVADALAHPRRRQARGHRAKRQRVCDQRIHRRAKPRRPARRPALRRGRERAHTRRPAPERPPAHAPRAHRQARARPHRPCDRSCREHAPRHAHADRPPCGVSGDTAASAQRATNPLASAACEGRRRGPGHGARRPAVVEADL